MYSPTRINGSTSCAALLTLLLTPACTLDTKVGGNPDSETDTEDGSGTGSTGSTDGTDDADETATPTTSDSDGGEACPSPEPEAKWSIELMWNDDGPPGFEPDLQDELEVRDAACTVSAVDAESEPTIGLDCTYAGENEPRPHALKLSLPTGPGVDLAVGDAVELEYRRHSHFETGTTSHLELHRDGTTVLAAGDAPGVFSFCHDSGVIEDFSEFGLSLTHASCEPALNERVDFSIDGTTTSLWHGTTGPLSGGFVGVVDTATRDELDEFTATCNYKILVYLAAQ
jgi:hypothetical protein